MNLLFFLCLMALLPVEGYTPFRTYRMHKLYEAGDAAGARLLADEAIAADPHDWRALYNAAVLAVVAQELDEAIKNLEKALELNPNEELIKKLLEALRARREQQQQQQNQKEQQQKEKESEGDQSSDSQEGDKKSEKASQDGSSKQDKNGSGQEDQKERDAQQQQSSSQKNQQGDAGASSQESARNGSSSECAPQGQEQQKSKETPGTQGTKDTAGKPEDRKEQAASAQQGAESESPSAAQQKLRDELNRALEQSMSQGERYLMRLVEGNDQLLQKQLLQRAMAQGEQGGSHDW